MVQIADRISRLGTETAFAVSGEANAFAAKGNRVYPFHLGDMNLATPSTVVHGSVEAIKAGKTGYCPNAGIPALREALAEDINASRGTSYGAENVVVQPGGKPTIGKLILALMNPGDEVLYPNPGYPIYESQIEFHGGVAKPYSFIEGDDNFALDMEGLEASLTEKTKILIVNDLQNPTGAECSDRGAGAPGQDRHRARPGGAGGRGLLRHPLRGQEPLPGQPARHGGAHRDPLHLLQEVRHDGLAAGGHHRPEADRRRGRQAERERRVLLEPLHPVRRRRGPQGRPGRGRGRSWRSSRSAATSPSTSSTPSTAYAASARTRPSTCSRTSPRP